MPGGSRAAVGPVNDKRLAELIEPVVAAAGMDLESVRMSVAGKRRLLRIVVDGDHGATRSPRCRTPWRSPRPGWTAR
jgi:hypothetical protein